MKNAFTLNPNFSKPYALMDLDDTLFQTLRKIEAWALPSDSLTIASVNKQGEPLSYFTPKQAAFFNWLYHTTELIPVTARDTTEIKRVTLPFASWQVLTHGAIILDNKGNHLVMWQQHMAETLTSMQAVIVAIHDFIEKNFSHSKLQLTIHQENFSHAFNSNLKSTTDSKLAVYLAIKQVDKDPNVLQNLVNCLPAQFPQFSDYFYSHMNANNVAILPHAVHKRYAVQFLLDNYFDKNRANFGFGDSLADLPFLQQLDWYGTPSRGQLHEYFKAN